MLQETYTELQKPVARLMEMSADEVIRAQKISWGKARWDEAARKHHAEVRAEAKGKAIRAAEIAANMRQEGLPVNIIAKVTNLRGGCVCKNIKRAALTSFQGLPLAQGFPAGMKDPQYLYFVVFHAIRNDERQLVHDKLPGAKNAP